MKLFPTQIELALTFVIDPHQQKDIVSLQMIENIQIEGNKVLVWIFAGYDYSFIHKVQLKRECITAIQQQISPEIEVEVYFKERKLTPEAEEKYQLIKNCIAIASGKGGVGKSTVAANIAISLAKTGAKVGLLDADIYGPSIPTLFNVTGRELEIIEQENRSAKIIPIEKAGIQLMSIGFFAQDNQALVWRGAMASNALKQMILQTNWTELDYLIVDMPPGTGDIHLTIVNLLPLTSAIMVTTPQQIAIADVRRALDMFKQDDIQIPIMGIVENMVYFIPENEQNGKKYYLFGKDTGKRFAEEMNLEILAEIPLFYFDEKEFDFLEHSLENSLIQNTYSKLVTTILNKTNTRLNF